MDSGDISTPFFDICVHLSAPLILVIVCNHSIRKLVFHRSNGINFNTFCACCSTSFQVSFLNSCSVLGCHVGKHVSGNSEKGIRQHENDTLLTFREAPRHAASHAHFSNKKKQLELKMVFEFVPLHSCKQMLVHAV